MKKIIVPLVLIALLACKTEITKVSAVGKINSVLVVVDDDKWHSEVGTLIKDFLTRGLVGFPQEEFRFSLSQISSRNFNKMLRHSRNIVSISFTTKNSFTVLKDKYAAPQRVIVITAKDKDNLKVLLEQHEKEIVQVFKESDIKTKQKTLLKKYWKPASINTFKNLQVSLKIPYAYLKVQDTLDYIWFRKDIPEGYLNLQLYAIPITSENEFTKEAIITYRDQKGQEFIPGEKEGMYLVTEKAFTPVQYQKTMLGRKMIETRGTWEMKKGFMAGPFLNYALLDQKNNRIIVAEGFVYAPNVSKRDYLFELEALLKTLDIK